MVPESNLSDSLASKLGRLWDRVERSPAMRPGRIDIPPDHITDNRNVGDHLREDKCYFHILINEMYLTYKRDKTKKVDPMVLSLTEFTYDDRSFTVPHVLGRSVLKGHFSNEIKDQGILVSNAIVAGPYPYRGGTLKTTIVLCELEREDYAQMVLNLLEQAVGIVPSATALIRYMKLAGLLYDGFSGILGSSGTEPVVGNQMSTNPDVGEPLVFGYHALINRDERDIDEGRLYVKDKRLCVGDDMASAKPYRDADYVLYSVVPSDARTDEDQLPFFPLYKKAKEEAARLDPASWESAWVRYSICYSAIQTSPDLIDRHRDDLDDRFQYELDKRISRSRDLAIRRGLLKREDGRMEPKDEGDEPEDAGPREEPKDEGDEAEEAGPPENWIFKEDSRRRVQRDVQQMVQQMQMDQELF